MIPEVATNSIVFQGILLRGEPLAKRLRICAGPNPIPDRAFLEAAIEIPNQAVLRPQVLSEVREKKDEPAGLVMIPLTGAERCTFYGVEEIGSRVGPSSVEEARLVSAIKHTSPDVLDSMDALKQLFQEGGSASRILNAGEWSSLDMEVGKHRVDPFGFLFVSGAHEPPRLWGI